MRWALLALMLLAEASRAAQPAAEAVLLAWADVRRLPPPDRPSTRYLWVSDPDPKLRWRTWGAAAGHLNFLSLSRRVVSPALVLADGSVKSWAEMGPEDWGRLALLRLNLKDYKQTPQQWDRLGHPDLEPVFHVWTQLPDGKWAKALAPWLLAPLGADPKANYQEAVAGLVAATGYSQAPVIEARNFVWQTAVDFDRKAGYYSWLGVKDKASFDRLVRLDPTLEPLREAVAESGVASEPRAVERFGRGDGYWITYDQVNQRAQGRRNPLLTADRSEFLFDASEVFGRLDNGLWAMGLFDSKGVVQQSAPDGVGYNHTTASNDGKIHVCLACLSCHDAGPGAGGLKPFAPYFRSLYAGPGPLAAAAVKKGPLAAFAEQYLTPLEPWADGDKRAYAAALFQANGLTPQQYARNLYETYASWDRPLDLEAAASEHGLAADDFVKGLQAALVARGELDAANVQWIAPAARRTRIGRNQFAEAYNRAELALRGLPAWPAEVKQKLVPWRK